MGKVHRIKKAFRKVVSQQPLQGGNYSLNGRTSVFVGRRYNGSMYLMQRSWSHAYNPLIKKLIKEYQAGVGHTD